MDCHDVSRVSSYGARSHVENRSAGSRPAAPKAVSTSASGVTGQPPAGGHRRGRSRTPAGRPRRAARPGAGGALEGAGLEQRDGVSRDQHDVEELSGVEDSQVGHPPVQLGRLLASHRQHGGVEVDAHHGVAELGQPDRDPAGAAARVEHPRRRVGDPGHEGRLAVHVVATRGQRAEPLGVLLRVVGADGRAAISCQRVISPSVVAPREVRVAHGDHAKTSRVPNPSVMPPVLSRSRLVEE